MRITLTDDRPAMLEIDRTTLKDRESVEVFVDQIRLAAAILWPREHMSINDLLRDRE